MTFDTIRSRVFETVAHVGHFNAASLHESTGLRDDLGFDGIDMCETAVLVEKAFDIDILPEEEDRLTDLGSLARLIEVKLATRFV